MSEEKFIYLGVISDHVIKKGFEITRATLINWAKKYGGKKVAGRWYMRMSDIEKILNGDVKVTYKIVDKLKKKKGSK